MISKYTNQIRLVMLPVIYICAAVWAVPSAALAAQSEYMSLEQEWLFMTATIGPGKGGTGSSQNPEFMSLENFKAMRQFAKINGIKFPQIKKITKADLMAAEEFYRSSHLPEKDKKVFRSVLDRLKGLKLD